MNKQKEIEKIKTIMGCDYDYCESCYTHSRKSCSLRPIAERLVDAGYGNVRAAVREFAGVLRDKIFQEHSLGTQGYIVGFKEMKKLALADVDALVKEVCGDEYK